jgi:hypothetical protein
MQERVSAVFTTVITSSADVALCGLSASLEEKVTVKHTEEMKKNVYKIEAFCFTRHISFSYGIQNLFETELTNPNSKADKEEREGRENVKKEQKSYGERKEQIETCKRERRKCSLNFCEYFLINSKQKYMKFNGSADNGCGDFGYWCGEECFCRVCRDWLFWLLVWKRWFCRVYRDW